MAEGTSLRKAKELLTRAINPLYLYDDDADGLCSYLLLKRKFKKGAGIVVKTNPKLGIDFLQQINRHDFDLLVILDKPIVEQELIDKIKRPILYIDHHPVQELKGLHYVNPMIKNSKDNQPTTQLCYGIAKQDEWIAGIGIIADWFLPKFIRKLNKKYPDLISSTKSGPDIMFNQKFGLVIKVFSFILKGDNRWLNECVNILEKAESPYEIIENKESILFKRFEEVNKKYEELLAAAEKEIIHEKLVVFTYPSGKVSLTGELANEIYYRNPGKFIVVAREKDDDMKLSARGKNALKILNVALKGIKGYGGGHENACGGSVAKGDFSRFIGNIRGLL